MAFFKNTEKKYTDYDLERKFQEGYEAALLINKYGINNPYKKEEFEDKESYTEKDLERSFQEGYEAAQEGYEAVKKEFEAKKLEAKKEAIAKNKLKLKIREAQKAAEAKKKSETKITEDKKVSNSSKFKAKEHNISNTKVKILFIEDDRDMRDLVAGHLEYSGFDLLKAEDGIKGKALALKYSPDLILLDYMLPKVDGVTLCHRLRKDERTSNIPILMITALSGLNEKVCKKNSRADDFITKPFDLEELYIRIKALLRRTNRAQLNSSIQQEILNYGPLTLVPERFEAIWFELPVKLTYLEFELLHCLLQRHDQTISPALILKIIWGYESDDDSDILTIRDLINQLCTKLEPDPIKPIFIKTIYGEGYCLNLSNIF